MDTKKIGAFLKQLRKENGMTQEQLGDRIGVTNKTVSRWETGSYMPPVECLEVLSEIYQISINEILAGERVAGEHIKEVAEENVSTVLGELQQQNKKLEKNMHIILTITTILTIAIIVLLPIKSIKDIVILVMVIALGLISNTLNMVVLVLKKENK